MEDLLGVDLQFLEMSAKILQFIDPSLERTSLVDILGTSKLEPNMSLCTMAGRFLIRTFCLHMMSL